VFAHLARSAEVALVDGMPGIVVAPRGRLFAALRLKIGHGRITEIDVIADPAVLDQLRSPQVGPDRTHWPRTACPNPRASRSNSPSATNKQYEQNANDLLLAQVKMPLASCW
jgi:hypothetical protein